MRISDWSSDVCSSDLWCAFENRKNAKDRLDADARPRLASHATDMRCDNDFWLSPEWMVCSGWFRREGVEARTRQMSATDCIKQSSFIYQTAARRVDEVSAPGQLGDGRRVDERERLLCHRAKIGRASGRE